MISKSDSNSTALPCSKPVFCFDHSFARSFITDELHLARLTFVDFNLCAGSQLLQERQL
jgi:hypothetical protein